MSQPPEVVERGLSDRFLRICRALSLLVLVFGLLTLVLPPALDDYCITNVPEGVTETSHLSQTRQWFPPGYVCTWGLDDGRVVVKRPEILTPYTLVAALGLLVTIVINVVLGQRRRVPQPSGSYPPP